MDYQQETFSPYNEPETIIASNEPHMALMFVLDVSGSMGAEGRIDELNRGLNRFKEEVCKDKQARRILDVAIITFNHDCPPPAQNFLPVEEMRYCDFQASGGTSFVEPIERALTMVRDRRKFYEQYTTPYKPWIVFITDGEPSDEAYELEEIAKKIRQQGDAGKVSFRSLGVKGYNSQILHKFSDNVMRLEGSSFESFFDWVNKSMASISQSSPGEKPQSHALEGNVYRDRGTDDMD